MKYRFFVCLASLCIASGALNAAEQGEKSVEECSRELLLAFFPEPFVKETLKKFDVPEAERQAIASQLMSKDKEVVPMVEEKAAKMDPNPLLDPQYRQQAVQLYRETLLSIFSDVMKANGVTDEQKIQAMLDDIHKQKAERFAKCMQRPAKS